MADSTTTLNPKMSWRLKLLLLHSMLSQVIYRKSLHPENIHKNRFHRSSRDILVLRIATLNLEDAQHQPCPSGLTPKNWTIEKCSSAQVKEAERNEEEIHRGADHRDIERGASQWSQSNLRQAQHQRGDLLQLEAQVWRDGGSRGAATTCARG